MNDKLHGLEPAWITALGAAAAAAVGAFGLWLANRMLGKAAFQTAINAGFRGLLEEVNTDRTALKIMLREATTEREKLRGEVRELHQIIDSLCHLLRDHGIPIPSKGIRDPLNFIEVHLQDDREPGE